MVCEQDSGSVGCRPHPTISLLLHLHPGPALPNDDISINTPCTITLSRPSNEGCNFRYNRSIEQLIGVVTNMTVLVLLKPLVKRSSGSGLLEVRSVGVPNFCIGYICKETVEYLLLPAGDYQRHRADHHYHLDRCVICVMPISVL